MKKTNSTKNMNKIVFPTQYSMYFPDNPEVLYIIVSIRLHIGNDMDKGHYFCDVLDYLKVTWRNCGYETITKYPGY